MIASVTVVVAPVIAITEFFKSVGDALFGSRAQEFIELMNIYYESEEGKREIEVYYLPAINQVIDKAPVKLEHLVIPNLLAGISSMDNLDGSESSHDLSSIIDEQINLLVQRQENEIITENEDGEKESTIEITYSMLSMAEYTTKLKSIDLYAEAFQNVAGSTLQAYIEAAPRVPVQDGLDSAFLEANKDDYIYPLKEKAVITSRYGNRYLTGVPGMKDGWNLHTGIDLAFGGSKACGEPIYAVRDGVVIGSDSNKPPGSIDKAYYGIILHANTESHYWHLKEPFPRPIGTTLKKGDWVGYIGNTGFSSGCHLHFGMKYNGSFVNPENYIDFNNPNLP